MVVINNQYVGLANIGFFGDSYVDLNIDFHRQHPFADADWGIWAYRLCKDLRYKPVTSGLGGSNQFYAISTWQEYVSKFAPPDVAVFTFTWNHRLYSNKKEMQEIYSLTVEKKDLAKLKNVPENFEEIRKAVELYYKYLYNESESLFNHEQSIKWCLDLPEQYPNTKFIFLPNTETSRTLSLKHFRTGVLIDFAFERISQLEGENVGVDPYDYAKVGHLTESNHIKFKDIVKNLILDYQSYQNKIYKLDYGIFKK